MNSIKEVRACFGFSQQQLADYFSITLSHFKMVERGKRSLPTAAQFKLVALLNFDLAKAGKTERPELVQNRHSRKQPGKALYVQASRFENMARVVTRQLEKVQTRYQQAEAFLALVPQLLNELGADEEGQKDSLWLQIQQTQAIAHFKKYGPEAQALLQCKIDCFSFGAANSREQADKLKNQQV